ncbi:MAG: S-adenosylmethionine:tRNA ribosyltransferase-isomerase [Cyclobacteriaceae bacterium]|nr:S-adenosylmethionine:tRNA ribosyltransferase-isomerase [Cyclobacteriaceae bacterium]
MRLGINCPFVIEKSDIDYQRNDLPDYRKVFQHILENAKFDGDFLTGKTGIFIYPSYDFKVVNGLITNFHLPGSTLILLIAAFVGEDWKKIYQSALDNDYRFLSYGDSSLLLPKK